MADAVWNPAHDTGIAEIDRQHRDLLACANELGKSMAGLLGDGTTMAAMEHFGRLLAHHFRCEERLMVASAYPSEAHHRRMHIEMERALAAVIDNVRTHGRCDAVLLTEVLVKIVTTHVVEADLPMAVWLKSHPVNG
jgi:hemerythrin